MKSICVYCGSSFGNQTRYAEAARSLASVMAENNLELVYGGGNVGLMGVIANEMLRLGGKVTGVIPKALMDKEVGHRGLTNTHIVKDMHERKAMMAELSDGFIAMPGGIGTLEELFEMLTWSQLDFHRKPIGVLNVDGFYAGLIDFLQHLVNTDFVKADQAALMMHEAEPAALIARLQNWIPQKSTKLRDALAAQALFP